MSLLKKSDLEEKYSWTAIDDDDPKITGKPDSTLLNKHEGYEVLPFINRFAEKHNLKNKSSGLKAERLIRHDLPSDKRSHAHVNQWLVDNWDN